MKETIVGFEYEVIDEFHARYKVFGGWIVENYDRDIRFNSGNLRTTLVFVPDPNHEWVLKKEEKGEG